MAYGYDAASNRASLTDPKNSTTTYTYDTLNRLSNILDFNNNNFGFNYDAVSRRTQLTRPNGMNTNYGYDSVSNLLSVLHQQGTTTLDGASYTYDSAGNRKSKTNLLNNTTANFSYDNIYQLTGVTGPNAEAYTYDPVGNRLTSQTVSNYAYNNSNQLTTAGSATYTYDNNDNTQTKTDATGITTYTWDFENRLTGVQLPNSTTVSFKYDPFGRRIEKSAATTTNYVYDEANVIEEVDQSGNLLAHYSQGAGIDEPLSELRSGAISYYEQDGLGSVTSLSGSGGTLANTYTYESFGNTLSSTGTVTNPYQYTGRDYDPETGLRYYRARYVNSTTGRFLSEDPLQFGGGINFYSYTANAPVSFRDPIGLKDYNEQETLELLQQAYNQATAGRWQGIINIRNNSQGGGPYDFGHDPNGVHQNDTWTRCGRKMNAWQFGNYMAGFQGAAYDEYYFWTTGAIWAETAVKAAGLYYHLTGDTNAQDDPFDKTGRPDINNGEQDGWNFHNRGKSCGCDIPKSSTGMDPYQGYVLSQGPH